MSAEESFLRGYMTSETISRQMSHVAKPMTSLSYLVFMIDVQKLITCLLVACEYSHLLSLHVTGHVPVLCLKTTLSKTV